MTDESYSRLGLRPEYHVLVGETLKVQPSLQLTCQAQVGSWRESTFEFSPRDHGRQVVTFHHGGSSYPVEIWVYLDYRALVKRGCVLGPSAAGWDASSLSDCSIFEEDGRYCMFYSATPFVLGQRDQGIGLAVSSGLYHWDKHPDNPLLTASKHSWLPAQQTAQFALPLVTRLGGTYLMYYDVYSHFGEIDRWQEGKPDTEAIGVATSPDLYRWTPHPGNPVLTAGEPWEGTCVYAPAIVNENGLIYLLYTGYSDGQCHLGVAVSDDGVHFVKHQGNPVFDCYTRGTWEDHGCPQSQSILKDNGVYWMYYQIKEPVEIITHEDGQRTFLGDRCRTAMAFSTDLYHWRQCPRFAGYDNKCILDVGPPGTIDEVQASPDWMVRRGDTFYLFYHAIKGFTESQLVIALATYDLPCRSA